VLPGELSKPATATLRFFPEAGPPGVAAAGADECPMLPFLGLAAVAPLLNVSEGPKASPFPPPPPMPLVAPWDARLDVTRCS
jgi:hypothetical protein